MSDEQTQVLEAVAGETPPSSPHRWRPGPVGSSARVVILFALLALVVWLPHLVPKFQVQIVARAGIYALIALSMNMLMGYAGQVSLGHVAFYGIGAFASGTVTSDIGLPFAFGIAAAGLTGAAAALLLGAIALRLQGLYLALVTIAYGAVAQLSLFKLSVFKGGAGVSAPRPAGFTGDIAYTYLIFGFIAVTLYIDWRLVASKPGRAIQALRDDERVAASWGINVTAFKLLVFVMSGSIAGVAGGLFAHLIGVVSNEEFNFLITSLTFVLMTVVGGLGSRVGAVIGGAFFAVLPTLLDRVHSGDLVGFLPPLTRFDATWEPLIGSVLLVVTLLQFPGGIAQQLGPVIRWLSFKPFHEQHHTVAVGGGTGGGGMGARP